MTDIGLPEPDDRWLGGRRPSMRPPTRIESRVALAGVALAVGFLVAIQATERPADRVSRLAAERPEDLTRILADLSTEAEELSDRVSDLQLRLVRYQSSAEREDLAIRDARDSLADLRVLSGTVPVEGPGLVLTVSDPERRVAWDALLDLVQELRGAGAEALSVEERRVTASTWFGPGETGEVMMDGAPLQSPYELEAIGPADTMTEALTIPGGALAVVDAQPGVSVDTRERGTLRFDAAERNDGFDYAEPVA
ncbi:MAG: DUF881 domain-containing protein [Actinomycetota bacterium]